MDAKYTAEDPESIDSVTDPIIVASPEIVKEKEEKDVTSFKNVEEPETENVSDAKAEPVEPRGGRPGYGTDDSGSGPDSCSEPSTVESQLSQGSDDETGLQASSPSKTSQPKKHSSRRLHGHSLVEWVKNMLVQSLEEQLRKTKGAEQAQQLETLLEKFHNSPEVGAEIEEIIMEKMSDGMANKEVAEITRQAQTMCLGETDVLETQQSKNLTETDVNSIMHLLGQIRQPESCSDSENVNDGNNNNQCIDGREAPNQDDTKELGKDRPDSKKDYSELEKAYWEAGSSESDPYTVGQVCVTNASLMSKQSDRCGDQIWDSKTNLMAKPRRERRRPYDRKRGKVKGHVYPMFFS